MTKTFRDLFGADPDSQMSGIVDHYSQVWRDRVAADEAEREALSGPGPRTAAARSAAEAASLADLRNSDVPIVSTFDAYCIVKDASKLNGDAGLKMAAHVLYDRWNSDALGYLTIGDLAGLREQLLDLFPRTAAAQVLEDDVLAVGFQTLDPELSLVAAEITDQDSYERAVVAHGLEGDDGAALRARTYVRALFERENDPTERPSLGDAIRTTALRWAQLGDLDEMSEEPLIESEQPEPEDVAGDELHGDASEVDSVEDDALHDENSEELTTIKSPVSGEELVLELGISENQNPGAGDTGGLEETEDGGGPLPMDKFEEPVELSAPVTAAKRRRAQVLPPTDQPELPAENLDPQSDPFSAADGLGDVDPSGVEIEDEDAGGVETATIIDPTSGEELKVTLERAESDEVDETDEVDTMDEPEEPSPTPPMDDLGRVSNKRDATKTKIFDKATGEPAYGRGSKSDRFSNPDSRDRGYMKRNVDEHDLGKADEVKDRRQNIKKLKDRNKRNPIASREGVLTFCAGLGVTPENLEESLLNGDDVVFNDYRIVIASDDRVQLFDGATLSKSASLSKLDGMIFDFMALTAKALAPTGDVKKAATKTEKRSSYVLVSDVPQGAPINAKRMMSTVWEVNPDAEGELLDNGRLSIRVAAATEREMNRLHRVLTDVYGIRQIEAKVLSKTAGQLQDTLNVLGDIQAKLQATDGDSKLLWEARRLDQKLRVMGQVSPEIAARVRELSKATGVLYSVPSPGDEATKVLPAVAAKSDSPYVGKPPVKRQQAGAPMQPLQAPQQTMATGQQAQQDFVKRNLEVEKVAATRAAQLDEGDDPDLLDMDDGIDDPAFGGDVMDAMPPEDPMGAGPEMGMGMGGALQPADAEAVRAAMEHFRNTGMSPLDCVAEFTKSYKGLLDKYGDETSPQRAAAEAEVIKLMTEAFQKPAVIAPPGTQPTGAPPPTGQPGAPAPAPAPSPMTPIAARRSADTRKADLPTPKFKAQQPDAVSVGTTFPEGDFNITPNTKPQQKPSGKRSKPGLPSDNGNGFPAISTGTPQGASQKKQRGTSRSTPVLGPDDSKGHRGGPASTKTASDLYVKFDMDHGLFELARGEKKIASFGSYGEVLAEAERRALGRDLSIYVDDGDGEWRLHE